MKRLILICLTLLTACTSAVTVTPQPVTAPTVAAQATPTTQPKAKNPTVAPVAANADFVVPEILGRPTDHSITLNVVPAAAMDIVVEYSTTAGTYDQQSAAVSAPGGSPIEITLDQLQANTRYYYRLRYANSIGPERTFMTQRAAGSTFTFGIQGDSHPERVNKQFDADLYTRTLLSAASDQPDFYLTIGDDFSVDALKNVNPQTVAEQYLNQRNWLGLVGAPVFLVNGNHEQASLANLNGTADNVAVWAQTARNAYYPQPAPDAFYTGDAEPVEFIGPLRDYYAFTWGDALFVVIDPYWHSPQTVDNQFGADRDQKGQRDLWNVTLGDAQYQWFKQILESSTTQYKFVFTHHVLGTGRGGIEVANGYEWGDAANLAAHRPGWDKTIQQVMADNHVTIFFQGHDHIFVKQELDGVIYQSLPEPAHPGYTFENETAYKTGDKFPNSGHVRVAVSPENVTVDYVRSYLDKPDEVAFTYTILSSGAVSQATTSTVETPPANRGSDATQSMNFEVPAQPIDVILGRPAQSSVTASVLAYQASEAYIEYGVSDLTTQTSPQTFNANQPASIVLDALQPDTAYTYRVRYRTGNTGEFSATDTRTFRTQRAADSAFTFAIQADSHLDTNSSLEVYAQTLANERAAQPDFLIDLGDTFMTDKYQPYTMAQPQYLAQRALFGTLAPSPLFLVLGNHDGESSAPGGKSPDMPAWSAQLRTTYFPNPVPDAFYSGGAQQSYYAWTWGSALFIVLDPYTFTPSSRGVVDNWNRTLGEAQYAWLKQTLETSDATWKFVFIHQLVGGAGKDGRGGAEAVPYYEWGGQNADGTWGFDQNRSGWAMPIHQLLVAHHVTAVFHGHDHLFVKQALDGIVYQTVPQPNSARANAANSAVDYGYVSGDVLSSPGYLCVTVAPEHVTIDYVRTSLAGQTNGQVDYAYTLTP